VDFCNCRYYGNFNCITNGKLPGNKSSGSESREEFENGMNNKIIEIKNDER
jgi:hypothetical protein